MSNFVHEVGEDENFRSTIICNVENGGDHGSTPPTITSKKKRNIPGNPGKQVDIFHNQLE